MEYIDNSNVKNEILKEIKDFDIDVKEMIAEVVAQYADLGSEVDVLNEGLEVVKDCVFLDALLGDAMLKILMEKNILSKDELKSKVADFQGKMLILDNEILELFGKMKCGKHGS